MIMRARQEGGVIVFDLEGNLDFETTQKFEEICQQTLEKTATSRVVFNLEKLRFVGSTGIHQFIRILKEFNSFDEKPKYCRLSSEFQRVFRAFETTRKPFEIFEDESQARASFHLPRCPKKSKVKKKSSRS